MNAGEMEGEMVEIFNKLLEKGEECNRVNQYQQISYGV